MLVLHRCDELFAMGQVPFAAAHETHRDRKDTRRAGKRTQLLNAAVMSLQPDAFFLRRVRELIQTDTIRQAVEHHGTAGAPTFQSVIDTFFMERSLRQGFAAWTE